MNLLNKQVSHKTYGRGSVVNLSDSFVEIQFPIGNKKFVYPDAFGTYLILTDPNTASSVKQMKEKQQIKLKAKEMREEEERTAKIKEQQTRIQMENLIKNLKIHPSSQAVFWCCDEDQETIFEKWSLFTGFVKSSEKQGRINRPARLNLNSVCLLTARSPEEPEQQRRILGAFMVDAGFVGKLCEDGIIHAHEEHRIRLAEDESDKMLFWNYCVNEKSPQSMTWNTGIYRYFDNIFMAQILRDMVTIKKGTSDQDIAKHFFAYYCRINRIDNSALPKPNGALVQVK